MGGPGHLVPTGLPARIRPQETVSSAGIETTSQAPSLTPSIHSCDCTFINSPLIEGPAVLSDDVMPRTRGLVWPPCRSRWLRKRESKLPTKSTKIGLKRRESAGKALPAQLLLVLVAGSIHPYIHTLRGLGAAVNSRTIQIVWSDNKCGRAV